MIRQLYLFLILTSGISFAQEILQGEIANSGDTASIHVFNKTHSKYTITDANGKFNIQAHPQDTIVFSALQYKLKEIIVTPKMLKNVQYVVLETKVNELDAVYIKPKLSGNLMEDVNNIKTKNPVTAKTLGLPNADVIPPTPAERRLQTASGLSPTLGGDLGGAGGSVSLDAVINAISGRTKKLKKIVRWERKSKLEDVVFANFESIIVTEFKIPHSEIYNFIYFASEDKIFVQIIKTNSSMVIYEFLQTKAKMYLKLQEFK